MEWQRLKAQLDRGQTVVPGTDEAETFNRLSARARKLTASINRVAAGERKIRRVFSKLCGQKVDSGFRLFPPFFTDCGKNIRVGKNVFINSGCCFQDQGGITIGDGCLIGHQVVLATLNHGLAPEERGSLNPKPIVLGKNVWVGAHATVLPGVTVGDNAVIAAGAVVTRDIPPDCVAAGVPAKIVKKCTDS